MTLVKICGITNIDDALACAELGADMLGFIFADGSPRLVSVVQAAGIIAAVRRAESGELISSQEASSLSPTLPPRGGGKADASGGGDSEIATEQRAIPQPLTPNPLCVGVFTEELAAVGQVVDACGLDLIQLHGSQSEEFAMGLGADRVIRVSRIKDEMSIDYLADFQSAKYYLLDTYKKGIPGGTGETFDWGLALLAKRLLKKPIILSGGLNPMNVYEVVRTVRPFAVDISSGVEMSPGRKDIKKVKELIENVRSADAS